MKPQFVGIDDPKLQPLLGVLNDMIVSRVRQATPDDFAPGELLAAMFGCRMVSQDTMYDSNGNVLKEALGFPGESGKFAKWVLQYKWDDDDKIQSVTLTDPDGSLQGRWTARWEWEGGTYGGDYVLDRWDFQTR